jgi:uncharacterized LabA/DUF88 family protein
MKDLDATKTIAVMIDAENAQHRTIGPILNELSKYGHVVARNAYGDWSSQHLKAWPEVLERLAIAPRQQFSRASGKNASDIAMVIDAMDMFHVEDFDAFALVSSDSDFAGLASRLRRGGKYVFGFGEEKTPESFRNACDAFVYTTLLGSSPPESAAEKTAVPRNKTSAELRQLIELFELAASEYGDADGWTLVSRAGSMIKRQRPDFDPRAFECKNLLQVIEKLHERFELRKVPRGEGTADEYRGRKR